MHKFAMRMKCVPHLRPTCLRRIPWLGHRTRCLPARSFKLIQQLSGRFYVLGALHYAAMQLHYYSPGDGHFFKNVLILFNVVIFLFSSCHFPWHTCCMFCWCRFSHFPWLEHKLATDTALAMRGTQQILCLSLILNFLLYFLLVVSCLHCPAASVCYATSWTT